MENTFGFIKGSTTERVYKFILSKRAVTSEEILNEFKHIPRTSVSSYTKYLVQKGYIVKSIERAQSKKRKCSGLFVYGIDQEAINQKLYFLNKQVDEAELLIGIKKEVYDNVLQSDKGFTTSEIVWELRNIGKYQDYQGYDYVYTCLRELIHTRKIKRSPFKVPDTCMINGRKPGFIYGRDDRAIVNKLVSLMPAEVKDAYLMITQSNEIYTIDSLEEKFKVTREQVLSWFDYRLITVGSLCSYSYKRRKYYYNPAVPLSVVEEKAPKIHDSLTIYSILNITTLGREFERQAVYYWVMYLITRYGLQIRLNADFPNKIPSWHNPDDIKKYTIGEGENRKLLVDVWTFDSEPIDYLIFCYDDILKVPMMGYVLSVKRDKKSKLLGSAGKKYIASMIGCLAKGVSYDMKSIPVVNALKPVMVLDNPLGYKLFEWARKTGCLLLYTKMMERIIEHVNSFGFKYEKDMEIKKFKDYQKLFEQYKEHKDVVLGKVQLDELIKRKVREK